jgi:hypothetical protein
LPKIPEDDKKGIDMPELAKSPTSDINTPNSLQSFFRPIPLAVQRRYKVANDLRKMGRSAGQPSHSGPALPVEKYLRNIAGGEELNKPERNFFESRMNADFSSVKLHTDRLANESAEGIQALAYTHANHIVFGSGQYQPHTNQGKKLMAHELTHVIQQNSTSNQSNKLLQRHDAPALWCAAFMDLGRYEDAHGKWGVITHYHSLSNDRLIPLNFNIPSIFGDVDVDWMFRLAFIQYPFIISSIFSPSMSEGFGGLFSRAGQIGLKGFWNTIRATAPEWDLEYGSILEEGNWNSSTAIVAWIHQDLSLRDIFSPAISLCPSS